MRGNMEMKKRNLSQEKIIDCFRELAEEMDVQQITFQHLAKRLYIKAPSLYNHFKNIRDVKTALTAKLLQCFLTTFSHKSPSQLVIKFLQKFRC